jgi:hypothetical protein
MDRLCESFPAVNCFSRSCDLNGPEANCAQLIDEIAPKHVNDVNLMELFPCMEGAASHLTSSIKMALCVSE